MRARLLTSLAASGVLALGMMAACASNDSTTHGFVATNDSGQMSNLGDDDSSIGHVVPGDDDASMLPTGDDDTTPPDATPGNGDDDDDATTGPGPGPDAAANDAGSDAAPASAHVCDGVIGPTEYGNEANGQHSYANAGGTGQTWYMDWDNVNLYVGLSNANVNEPAVIYVGENASMSTGNSFGFSTYDGTDPSSLPFPANFVVFAKGDAPGSPKYSEYRLANGTSWSATSQLTPAVQVCVPAGDAGGGTTREIVIPWAVMSGGGLPVGLKFLGYVETGNTNSPFIYGQMPSANPGGSNVTAAATQYFSVVNTAASAGLAPFANTL